MGSNKCNNKINKSDGRLSNKVKRRLSDRNTICVKN